MSEKKLKKVFKRSDPKVEYPKDLQTATKAEFITMSRQAKKDNNDGCWKGLLLACLIMVVLSMLAGVV
jgi:hypothetical protein